jgi:transcriptional regulator with XRE-family HTH domain
VDSLREGRYVAAVPRETDEGRVDNTPLRERFLYLRRAEDLTAAEVALRIGWTRSTKNGRPQAADDAKVANRLGLKPSVNYRTNKKGERVEYRYPLKSVDYDEAVLLAQAMHMDPHEAGV